MSCKINEIFVASPLESDDINKFKIKFGKVANNKFSLFDKDINEDVLFTLQDVNDIDEYYTKHFFVRNFFENKERIFKDYMQLYDVKEICEMKQDAIVDIDYLKLIEKTINEFYCDNK